MQNLQQKAHTSLQEFREGRMSPVTANISYKLFHEGTPEVEDDDELSKLGGKTRLISQKEHSKSPSPQVATRSPNTHNPIVPLPMPDATADVHPSVVEYLSSFNYPAGGQQGRHVGQMQEQPIYGPQTAGLYRFEDDRGSASAVHYHELPSPLPTPTSASSSSSHGLVLPTQQQAQPQGHPSEQQPYFPQYFPVFDYNTAQVGTGYAPMQVTGGSADFEQDHHMSYETLPPQSSAIVSLNGSGMNGMNTIDTRSYAGANGHQARRDITPDANMHTAWMDFVSQMSAGMSG